MAEVDADMRALVSHATAIGWSAVRQEVDGRPQLRLLCGCKGVHCIIVVAPRRPKAAPRAALAFMKQSPCYPDDPPTEPDFGADDPPSSEEPQHDR